MDKILSVSNLTKSFGKFKAVDNVSFEVHRGDILGLLGHNGAGKSTIIRCILGIKEQDSGDITFHIEAGLANNNAKIGYLPEERGLYKDASIMDVLLYLSDLKNYPKEKAKARIYHYLEKFDLVGKEKQKISAMSKGMAQKIQFISSIIHEPELLILDEPLSGLDPVSQDVIINEIKELSASGITILLSSHQMNFVESLCSHIFMIHKGRQIFNGTIAELKEKYGGEKEVVKVMEGPSLHEIFVRIVEGGGKINE